MSIATSLQALQTAKTDIGAAITAKGGTVGAGDGFADFATDIGTIPSGGSSEQLFNDLHNNLLEKFVFNGYLHYLPFDFLGNNTKLKYLEMQNVYRLRVDAFNASNATNSSIRSIDLKNTPLNSNTSDFNRVFGRANKLVYVRFGTGGTPYNLFQLMLNAVFRTMNLGGSNINYRYYFDLVGSTFENLIMRDNILHDLSDTASTVFGAASKIVGGTGFVWVPDLDADGNPLPAQYKVATNWVDIANSIKGFSDAPTITETTHTCGDVGKYNGKFYAYYDIDDSTDLPSGEARDDAHWHYCGEATL